MILAGGNWQTQGKGMGFNLEKAAAGNRCCLFIISQEKG